MRDIGLQPSQLIEVDSGPLVKRSIELGPRSDNIRSIDFPSFRLNPNSPAGTRPLANRPIKIFLSYSHADKELALPAGHPYLGKNCVEKLIKQLKSLEGEGIKLWWDKMIEPSSLWDKEIKAALSGCNVFLALTSSEFLNSTYIGNVEFSYATDRWNRNECLILNLVWKPWNLTSEWSPIQALNNKVAIEKSVTASMMSLDGVLSDVVREIHGTINNWYEKQSALTPIRAQGTSRTKPEKLPYYCDWDEPLIRLQDFSAEILTRHRQGEPQKPVVLFFVGHDDDCSGELEDRIWIDTSTQIRRVVEGNRAQRMPIHLPTLLRCKYAETDRSGRLEWLDDTLPGSEPADIKGLFFNWEAEFHAQMQKGQSGRWRGIRITQSKISNWNRLNQRALTLFFEQLSMSRLTIAPNQRLVFCIHCRNAQNNERVARQAEELAQGYSLHFLSFAMPQIKKDPVMTWARTTGHLRPEHRRPICDEVEKIFVMNNGFMRMGPLARHLTPALERIGV
jgi:hypothetical protein